MTDESNGESTFEFVEKKVAEFPVPISEPKQTESLESLISSLSSFSSNTSVLTLGSTLSGGNLLSNIAPPSALPAILTNPKPATSDATLGTDNTKAKVEKPVVDPVPAVASTSTVPPQTSPNASPTLESQLMDTGALAGNLFSWVKETVANSNVLSKVAEKAKNSVNSMITTLDPQMREFIYSGGDIEIVVASEKDVKVSPVREAFQNVFGKATVSPVIAEATSSAEQPVGFEAGIKAAQERIKFIRSNPSFPTEIPIVAVESFLLEVGPKMWYDLSVILLEDLKRDIRLQTFTQMTPVPSQIVESAQEATPKDYEKDGLSIPIGSLMGASLQVAHTEWHSALTSVSRKDVIFLAAQSLAGIYKNTINPV